MMHQTHSMNQKHLRNFNEYDKPHENDYSTKEELLFLKCLSSFVLTFLCQLKTTNYNSCENYIWGHSEKQNFSNIPVNIQEKISMQDVAEAAAKDTVLSEHLQKINIWDPTEDSSVNLEAILKWKISTTRHSTRSSTKSVLKKMVTIKASEKDRGMNQTNTLKVV